MKAASPRQKPPSVASKSTWLRTEKVSRRRHEGKATRKSKCNSLNRPFASTEGGQALIGFGVVCYILKRGSNGYLRFMVSSRA